MRYYYSKHLLDDYDLMLDWGSKWESPSEDSIYKVDIDIDGPDHSEDYLDWWRRCSPHHIGIHDMDPREDEGADEDTGDTWIGWDTPYTSVGWGGEYSSTYAHEESQDVGYDDNEEINPNEDDYELEPVEDTDTIEDDDEDDDGSLFILLIPYDFLHFYIM